MPLTYEQVRSSFVQHLSVLGLVSLDTGRKRQLEEAIDLFAKGYEKFLDAPAPDPEPEPAEPVTQPTRRKRDRSNG